MVINISLRNLDGNCNQNTLIFPILFSFKSRNIMNAYDIDKSFVSLYDSFLYEFDANHAKSESQLKEIEKYKRIFALRDKTELNSEKSILMEGF